MKKTVIALLAASVALSCATEQTTTEQSTLAKYEPADGKCILFVGQDIGATGGGDTVKGYVDYYDVPAGITIYTNIRPGDTSYGYTYNGLDGLISNADWGAGDCYADKLFSQERFKDCAVAIGLELVNHEQKVASGEHDSYIYSLGNWIRQSGRPVFLRIGYEFDGHPWNHYEADAYVAAFRRIRDIFTAEGIDNVTYVWQSKGAGSTDEDLKNYYPGDEYVDWCAYSQFAGGRCQKMIDLAREKGKPVLIAEATPMFRDAKSVQLDDPKDAEKAWNGWFADLFATINENPDVVKGVSYINCEWNSQKMWNSGNGIFGQIDARLQGSDEISAAWKEIIAGENFVKVVK